MNGLQTLGYDSTYSDTTPLSKKPKITETEYWEKYYHYPDITYEWNNGELEETGASDFSTSLMSEWFSELLNHYLRVHHTAKKTWLKMGFNLDLSSSGKAVRLPDLGIVLNSNAVPFLLEDESYKGIYDMCIEAISDSTQDDIDRDSKVKKIEYAQAGVKEYYILDGRNRYLAFYRLNTSGTYVPIQPTKEGIIKSSVLPGFQFRIEDLFTKPTPDEMINDPVYQGFVLPDYRKAQLQAAEEKRLRQLEALAKQKVELAKQKVEAELVKEKQRTQQLADKLRLLGINPDDL